MLMCSSSAVCVTVNSISREFPGIAWFTGVDIVYMQVASLNSVFNHGDLISLH